MLILDPAQVYLLVLAGMGSVFGNTGDVLAAGAPVGLMGGQEGAIVDGAGGAGEEGSGAGGTETLYIELRQEGATVDPGPWFVETKDK